MSKASGRLEISSFISNSSLSFKEERAKKP